MKTTHEEFTFFNCLDCRKQEKYKSAAFHLITFQSKWRFRLWIIYARKIITRFHIEYGLFLCSIIINDYTWLPLLVINNYGWVKLRGIQRVKIKFLVRGYSIKEIWLKGLRRWINSQQCWLTIRTDFITVHSNKYYTIQ